MLRDRFFRACTSFGPVQAMPSRLCLVLDLNGTLIYRSAEKLVHLRHDIKVNGKYIYFRPHMLEFFEFLAENRDHVELGIWTSMTPKNAYEIVSHLWRKVFLPKETQNDAKGGQTHDASKTRWSASSCQWRGPFVTDGGLLAETKETEIDALYEDFIGPIDNKTPIPIRFLFTQDTCLSRRKHSLLDDKDFRDFKPVMFKHLPLLWNRTRLSSSEVERVYGKAVITAGGNYQLDEKASFRAEAFRFPKMSHIPMAFAQENVLLLEDSHYKFLAAPLNGLVIPEYVPNGRAPHPSSRPVPMHGEGPHPAASESVLLDLIRKLEYFIGSEASVMDLLEREKSQHTGR
jgi:hypothetical protein